MIRKGDCAELCKAGPRSSMNTDDQRVTSRSIQEAHVGRTEVAIIQGDPAKAGATFVSAFERNSWHAASAQLAPDRRKHYRAIRCVLRGNVRPLQCVADATRMPLSA